MSATQTQPANGTSQRPASPAQTVFAWVERTYDLNALMARVDGYPEQISAAQTALSEAVSSLKGAVEQLDQHRQMVLAEVCSETDDKGKPLHSNEAKREAETTKRLAADPDAANLRALVRTLEQQKAGDQIAADRLANEFTASRARLGAITAVLNLVAAVSGK